MRLTILLLLISVCSVAHEKSPRKTINLSGLSYLYHAKSKDMVNIQEEIWKDVVGYEGSYQVSNQGQVKSLERWVKHPITGRQFAPGKILSQSFSAKYLSVCLNRNGVSKTWKVHLLVAMAFKCHVPNGHKMVINHKDLNKLNNWESNIEIIPHRENSNKKHIPHSSKYTGVTFRKDCGKWRACIVTNWEITNLGTFTNEFDAHLAYENALKSLA